MTEITLSKRTMSLLEAKTTAERLMDDLAPLCHPDKCCVAGSVRRNEPEVGDIELVCLPRTGKATMPGEMFPREQNLVYHYINTQNARRHGLHIKKGGPRYIQFLYGTTQIDLFMPLETQWGRILALRTGPAEYSKQMAARWVQMGYKGVKGRLVRTFGKNVRSSHYPLFHAEKGFFDFLRWNYVEPEDRGTQPL